MGSSESAAEKLLESVRRFIFIVHHWSKIQFIPTVQKSLCLVQCRPSALGGDSCLFSIQDTGQRREFVLACISLQCKTGMWLDSAPIPSHLKGLIEFSNLNQNQAYGIIQSSENRSSWFCFKLMWNFEHNCKLERPARKMTGSRKKMHESLDLHKFLIFLTLCIRSGVKTCDQQISIYHQSTGLLVSVFFFF